MLNQVVSKTLTRPEVADYDKPLFMTGLPLARLFDDIVVPYQTNETFFIDGTPVKPKSLKRIKILRAKPNLFNALSGLRRKMTRGPTDRQKICGEQFRVRHEAILRDYSEDVTVPPQGSWTVV